MAKKVIKIQIKKLQQIGFSDIEFIGTNSSNHPLFTGTNVNGETVKMSGVNTPSDHRALKNFYKVAERKYNGTYRPRYLNQ